jgi:ribosomal protein S18 acetylase RimI-like enzyme
VAFQERWMTVRFGKIDLTKLHGTWQEAFSDYAVDQTYMTEERIRARLTKNGFDERRSVGAYEESRLVGFTAIGLGAWEGESAAYDIATGIIPEYRGCGIAGRMLEQALPVLKADGITRFQLEVLQTNKQAIAAYEKSGFRVVREFICFQLTLPGVLVEMQAPDGVILQAGSLETVTHLRSATDWTPSWENSFDAIAKIPEKLVIYEAIVKGALAGMIVYSPGFNWIMNLTVDRSHRRAGIGSALIGRLAREFAGRKPVLKLNNVDAGDAGMIRLLTGTGFRKTVDQYEMARFI